jgi:hypothetical protein
VIGFLRRRLCERSTYAHLVTCLASAAGAAGALGTYVPRGWLLVLVAFTLVGALLPDGKPAPEKQPE